MTDIRELRRRRDERGPDHSRIIRTKLRAKLQPEGKLPLWNALSHALACNYAVKDRLQDDQQVVADSDATNRTLTPLLAELAGPDCWQQIAAHNLTFESMKL